MYGKRINMVKKQKDFLDEILDKYGDISLKEYPNGYPVISSGSLAVDVSTGIGGFPIGRYTEVWGPEQSAKTSLCLSTAREALRAKYKVLYIDVENSLDFSYMRHLLGDAYNKDLLLVLQPKSAENAFDLAEMGIDRKFDVIFFDSIGAISPERELEDDIEKQHVGLAPRLTNQFLRKTVFKVRDNKVAFIFTNQVRANIGSYVGGYSTPAGLALKHYVSLVLYLGKGEWIKDSDGEKIGHNIKFTVQKNKLAVPYRSAESCVIYGEGIHRLRDTVQFASLLGIIKSRGSYYVLEDETLGQGLAKTIEYLENHPELLDKIAEMCYNLVGINYPPARKEIEDGEAD
jgi:recombination protein RecA